MAVSKLLKEPVVDCLFERSRMASGDIVVSGHVKSDNMGRRNVDLSGGKF